MLTPAADGRRRRGKKHRFENQHPNGDEYRNRNWFANRSGRQQKMFRFVIALMILLLPCGLAQGPDVLPEEEEGATAEEFERSDLPDSPGARLSVQEPANQDGFLSTMERVQSRAKGGVIGDGTLSLEGFAAAIIRIRYALECNSDYYGRPERSASTAEQAVLVEILGLAAALQYAALERRRHSLLKEPVRRDDGRANSFGYGSKEPEGCTNNGDRA